MKKINCFNVLILVISVLTIIYMSYLTRYACFWGDDSSYSVFLQANEGLFYCIFGEGKVIHGGSYLGLLFCKLFSFWLPNSLGIHPADFVGSWHGAIRGVFTAVCLYILSKFSVFYTKSKAIQSLFFLFLTGYFFQNAMHSNVIIINYNFYRYFFSLIFFGIFVMYLYKNFLIDFKVKINNMKILIVTFCGLVIGTSIEIAIFTSAFFVGLIFLYYFVLSLKNIILKKSNKIDLKLNMNFYLPVAGLFLGLITFVSNPGFLSVATDRGMSKINIGLSGLKEFSLLYFQVCIKEETVYWIVFAIILCCSVYFAIRKNEIKKILFPLLLHISIMTVIFSLVLCGKTYDEITRDRYYLCHWNIVFLYKMLILYPLLMLFDYTFKNLLKRIYGRYRIYACVLLSVCILIGSSFYYNGIIKYHPFYNAHYFFYELKKKYYIAEKMLRFYLIKDETPILPDYNDEVSGCLYPYYRDINPSKQPIRDSYSVPYYGRIYFADKNNKYSKKRMKEYVKLRKDGYYTDKEAMDKFYKNGGVFSKKELKELKFLYLFDDDFVLNLKNQEN